MATTLTTVRLDQLVIPPEAPRTSYSAEGFRRLKASIERMGVLVPLIVRPSGDCAYSVIDGSTRLTAARELEWSAERELPVFAIDGPQVDAVAASVLINQASRRCRFSLPRPGSGVIGATARLP